MMTVKGLPLTYNRDMQETKSRCSRRRPVERFAGDGARCGRFGHPGSAKPWPPWRKAGGATDLAEALARSGTPFHQAHQLVGALVLESLRRGRKPADWTAADLAAFAPQFTPDLRACWRPGRHEIREIAGGTGPESVAAALCAAQQRLAAMRV